MTDTSSRRTGASVKPQQASNLTLATDHLYCIAFWRTAEHKEQASLEAELAPVVDHLQRAIGAVGAVLALSTDHLRVALHTQWVTSEACQSWMAFLLACTLPTPSDVDEFELAFIETLENARPLGEGDLIALGEFWMHDLSNQIILVERERFAAHAALRSPGMLSATFHRGLAGTRIVNLAQIETAEAVTRLASLPGFAATSGYWRDLARNEHHTYRIVRVVPPPAKQRKST